MTTRISGKRPDNTNSSYPKSARQPSWIDCDLRADATAIADPAGELHLNRPVRVTAVVAPNPQRRSRQLYGDVRVAISRAAGSRGLSVETVEGEGFVAVRKVDEPRTRKGNQAPPIEGQRRRGRPPKRQEQDAAGIASLQDLAAGES